MNGSKKRAKLKELKLKKIFRTIREGCNLVVKDIKHKTITRRKIKRIRVLMKETEVILRGDSIKYSFKNIKILVTFSGNGEIVLDTFPGNDKRLIFSPL